MNVFSVVIPTCLGGALLERCLESLLEHGPAHLQIVVVFDGPTRRPTRLPDSLPRHMTLEVVSLDESVGFCRAINRGIEKARFPVVQALNDDAFVLAHWYDAPMEAFEDADVGAVAPLILQDDAESENKTFRMVDSAGDRMNPLGVIRKRYRGQDRSRVEKSTTEVLCCGGCAGFFRADALRGVGGFPEDFVAYFDDVEVSLALRRLGYRILLEPASQVVHSGGKSYGPPRGALLTQQARNEERVYWQNLPLPLLFFLAIPRLWLLALRALVHLGRGTLPAWLLGKWQAAIAIGRSRKQGQPRPRDDGARVKAWCRWPWMV